MSFRSVAAAIRDRLVNESTVSAIVGNRVYRSVLPQNPVFPALVLDVLIDKPRDTIDGAASLFRADIQVDCWSQKASEAAALAEAVRLALQGYRGTHLSVKLRGIYITEQLDGFEPEVSDYKQILRFGVWYRRASPESA